MTVRFPAPMPQAFARFRRTLQGFAFPALLAAASFAPLLLEYQIFGRPQSLGLFVGMGAAAFALTLLLGRWALVPLLPCLLLSALVAPYLVLARAEVSYNVLASVLETNAGEAGEFLRSPFALRYGVLALAIVVAPLAAAVFWRRPAGRVAHVLLSLSVLASAGGFVHFTLTHPARAREVAFDSGLHRYFPLDQIHLWQRVVQDTLLVIRRYHNQSFEFDARRRSDMPVTVVLAIGEAARRSAFGIYGGPRATSAHLSALLQDRPRRLVIYRDAIAAAPFTRVSVPSMLSPLPAVSFSRLPEAPSIFRIADRAGVDTVFIARRDPASVHNQLTATLAQDSRTLVLTDTRYDHELLPFVRQALEAPDRRPARLVAVHFQGSHYRYHDRVPGSWRCFGPEGPEADYLDSIRYTDAVLAELISALEERPEPAVVLFASDHGEYVNDAGDGIFGHGFKDLTRGEIEIPLIFAFNEAFLRAYPETVERIRARADLPVSHDEIAHTVLGLLGIEAAAYYDARQDLGSADFQVHPRFILDRHMRTHALRTFRFATVSPADSGRTPYRCPDPDRPGRHGTPDNAETRRRAGGTPSAAG